MCLLYKGEEIEVEIYDKKYHLLVKEIEHSWDNIDLDKLQMESSVPSESIKLDNTTINFSILTYGKLF